MPSFSHVSYIVLIRLRFDWHSFNCTSSLYPLCHGALSPLSLPLQSLIFLGCVAAAGLGLNLLCLAIYLSCLCCCRKDEEEESKKPNSCCVTWSAVAAGLITW
uniref:Protein tweety homolog n=1 Tax=Seriola dumerili TaxID=41447 RepID=A0A3B4UJI5_SERDU